MAIGIYEVRFDTWHQNQMEHAVEQHLESEVLGGFIEPQWGFVEHGQCPHCNDFDDLWVNSRYVNADPSCLLCWFRMLYSAYPVQTDFSIAYLAVRNPNTWDVEDYERCWACNKSILHATGKDPIMARLADVDIEVKVHDQGACRTKCSCCNQTYATYHWRGIRNSGLVMGFRDMYNQTRCDACYLQEVDDYGGEENFFECGSCNSTFHLDDGTYEDHTPGTVCENCYDNYTYTCDDCGQTYWDGNHYCEAEDDDEGCIHDYSYKPRPFFFGEGDYHLGIELEVEACGNSRVEGADIVRSVLGERVYMKSDGSLDDGFEIVSHPHSLQEYATKFDWSVLERLRKNGYRSWNTDTCGLHVHVSRTAFGRIYTRKDIAKAQAHELRFMKLIYDNQRQVERIAGRSSNHYASFSDKGRLVSKVKNGSQSNGRYSVVNTDNTNTVEVRIFKGSLRKERVMSAIEFVTAAVEYTRDLKVTGSKNTLSWLHFTAYVAQNVEQYPNLSAIMEKAFSTDQVPSND